MALTAASLLVAIALVLAVARYAAWPARPYLVATAVVLVCVRLLVGGV